MKTKKYTLLATILAGAAALLLLAGSVGSAMAALTYYSEVYESPLAMREIGIQLYEGGNAVDNHGALLQSLVPEGEQLVPGKKYEDNIDVANNGEIDEFIRVVIYRYWMDGNTKDQSLDPTLIKYEMEDGWIYDAAQSTPEREVYYYSTAVSTGGVVDVISRISCDNAVLDYVSQTNDGKGTITTNYLYDGKTMGLKIEASGVQTHNGADAILSAWGANVTVTGNSLALQ